MRLIVIPLIVLGALPGFGQSFNVDLNIGFGGPDGGNGVPSDAFGAAADQPGRWNRVPILGSGPVSLVDLAGMPTSVTYSVNAHGGSNFGTGFNFPGNTGDFALLLNDTRQVGTQVAGGRNTFRFSGLAPGLYDIYTNAVRPSGAADTPVTVLEATVNQTQIVTGPMPGNSFAYLVTHSIHSVILPNGGDINVDIIQPPGVPLSYRVNGFQIIAVPEPATWVVILTFSAALCRKVRKRKT